MEKQHSFSRLEALVGVDAVNYLYDRSVFVLGVGGVGGYVCEALARSGIGKIILMDSDSVDITNLNRQIIALNSTIGMKKVLAMKERILDINPMCEVVCFDTFLTKDNISILDEVSFDFLVDACDTVSTKQSIIKYCLEKNIPFITCLGTAKKFDPSLLEITELKKTYNDPLARILRKYVKDNELKGFIPVLFSSELPIKCQELGSTAFVPSSAGLMIGSYVIKKFLEQKKG